MKYLGIHKLLWLLLVLLWLIVEIIVVGIAYVLYVIWCFRLCESNLWYNFHNRRSEWDGEWIEDRNPWQTLVRRYIIINDL